MSGLISQALDIGAIYFDVYPRLWSLTGSWITRLAPLWCRGEITHSLVFIFTYGFAQSLIGLPLDYYYHFHLEESFGFNKQTLSIWVSDFFKGQGLGLALGVPIGSAFLAIIKRTGDKFFYWLYLFALVVQVVMITIYPVLIVPLFNKLTPLPAGNLKQAVEALASKLNFPLTELQVIDGSKRSAHSNAYFTGLPGMKKKIVLFDTLVEKSKEKEVVAVLAHELGHWKLSHTMKQLGIGQLHLFFTFALFSAFVKNRSLYSDFGFVDERPIIVGFMLFNEILTPTDAVLRLLMNIMSRKFEFEADAFGAQLGYSRELASSLIKLQIQNLSAMDADWMYSAYTYSHPILTERLRALGWTSQERVAKTGPSISDEAKVVKASDREL